MWIVADLNAADIDDLLARYLARWRAEASAARNDLGM
jgi:hypothetical protein